VTKFSRGYVTGGERRGKAAGRRGLTWGVKRALPRKDGGGGTALEEDGVAKTRGGRKERTRKREFAKARRDTERMWGDHNSRKSQRGRKPATKDLRGTW